MDIEAIFKSIAEKLAIDFKYMSSEIEHRPSKGQVREVELAEQFLAKYLPSNVSLSHGEIVATDGSTSNELDIIVHDTRTCPALLDKSGYRIFPAECVHGVLEVKSKLDLRELEDGFAKIHRVKKFPKTAYEDQSGAVIDSTNLYDKNWPYFPTIGAIFGYESGDLLDLKKKLDDLHKNVQPEQRVDSVWVLSRGMIVNWDDSLKVITHTPTNKTRLRAVSSDNPLLLMTLQLQQIFQSAWSPKFKIKDYMQKVSYGKFLGE